VLSAFLSGSEVAFFSLKSSDIQNLKNDDSNNDLIKLIERPNLLLATILILNNFINVGIIILSAYFASTLIYLPENLILQFFIQVIIITFFLVLFGEVTPKIYARANSKNFAKMVSKPFVLVQKLIYPLALLLVSTTKIINKIFEKKYKEVTVDEISKVLKLAETDTTDEEARMLKSIIEFGNIDVKEVMKSRMDIVAIEKSTSFNDVIQIVIRSGFSRIPVYVNNLDDVVGILYIKDLIPFLDEKNVNWTKFCREAYYVPETKMINDLLKEFQINKNHIAIVVDEYGGTSGMVTLEDILEEIVGEINDEFDAEENIYSKLDNNNFIFEGKLSLIDFLKIVKGKSDFFDNIKGESDTIAGLIIEKEGKILKIGETSYISPYTFIIESADKKRINRIKVKIDE
tara:strand:+ start:2173 stop:3378 length:1206 start_codon:yes stop_codon:yes gene_type:complete